VDEKTPPLKLRLVKVEEREWIDKVPLPNVPVEHGRQGNVLPPSPRG
jgi:hypothetical protein